MKTVPLSRALAESLEALESGQSLESCLERYPQYRDELRSLLQVALTLREARKAKQPPPNFIDDLKRRLSEARRSPPKDRNHQNN